MKCLKQTEIFQRGMIPLLLNPLMLINTPFFRESLPLDLSTCPRVPVRFCVRQILTIINHLKRLINTHITFNYTFSAKLS